MIISSGCESCEQRNSSELADSGTENEQQQMGLQHSIQKKSKPSIAEYSMLYSPLSPLCCFLFDEWYKITTLMVYKTQTLQSLLIIIVILIVTCCWLFLYRGHPGQSPVSVLSGLVPRCLPRETQLHTTGKIRKHPNIDPSGHSCTIFLGQ